MGKAKEIERHEKHKTQCVFFPELSCEGRKVQTLH